VDRAVDLAAAGLLLLLWRVLADTINL